MSYPTSPDYTAFNFKGVSNTVKSETRSGKIQVRTVGAQRWEFSASYKDLTRAQFMPVAAFIMSQDGSAGVFTVTPPVISSASGSVSGTVLVNNLSGYAAGSTSVAIDGITGVLKAGDVIKFAGHSKVYMVTADRSGAGSLSFTPALVEAVANNEAITYDNVPFNVRLKNDVQEYKANGYDRYTFEVDFIEVV